MTKKIKGILSSVSVFIAVIMFALLLTSPFGTVETQAKTSASSISSDINNVKNQLSELEKKQNALEKKLASAKSQKQQSLKTKQLLEEQISSLESEMKVLSDYISSLAEDEKVLENRIDELQAEYDDSYAKYCERVRLNYEKGKISYLEILLGAESFSDMLTRMDYVMAVTRYDNSLVEKMAANLEETKQSKATLEQAIAENKSASAQLKNKQSSYKNKVSTLESTIADLEDNIDSYAEDIAEFSRLEREFQKQLDALMDQQKAYMGGDYFIWPLPSSSTITSYFGYRTYRLNGKTITDYHDALDISAPGGTPIIAAGSGKVIFAGWVTTGGGYKTVIDHGGNISTQYCHQSRILVKTGQEVKQGDTIGLVGRTGAASGNHLHFKITKGGTAVNPIYYVNYRNDFSSLKKING